MYTAQPGSVENEDLEGFGFPSDIGSDDAMDDYPRVLAVHDYNARSPSEMSFRKGDLIVVVDEVDVHWGKGILRNKTGAVPYAYVEHCLSWRDFESPDHDGAHVQKVRTQK
jgi:hypothetical protein